MTGLCANILEYQFISQPSQSNAGGVGFFISGNWIFFVRNDLSESTIGYETLWIEIQCNLRHNLICSVIYRHPNSDLESFLSALNATIDKINCENKYCIMMGDFNIDHLNSDSHLNTDEIFHIS